MTTIFSVLGGCLSYFIGLFLWDQANLFFANYYPSINSKINSFIPQFKEYGLALILVGGFSPFPYKVTCLAAGIMNLNFLLFIVLSFISRGIRFLLVSYLLYKFEEKANKLISKYIGLLSIVLIIFIVLYFVL